MSRIPTCRLSFSLFEAANTVAENWNVGSEATTNHMMHNQTLQSRQTVANKWSPSRRGSQVFSIGASLSSPQRRGVEVAQITQVQIGPNRRTDKDSQGETNGAAV